MTGIIVMCQQNVVQLVKRFDKARFRRFLVFVFVKQFNQGRSIQFFGQTTDGFPFLLMFFGSVNFSGKHISAVDFRYVVSKG